MPAGVPCDARGHPALQRRLQDAGGACEAPPPNLTGALQPLAKFTTTTSRRHKFSTSPCHNAVMQGAPFTLLASQTSDSSDRSCARQAHQGVVKRSRQTHQTTPHAASRAHASLLVRAVRLPHTELLACETARHPAGRLLVFGVPHESAHHLPGATRHPTRLDAAWRGLTQCGVRAPRLQKAEKACRASWPAGLRFAGGLRKRHAPPGVSPRAGWALRARAARLRSADSASPRP